MNKQPQDRKTVFATPWFQVLAAPAPGGGEPHYERGVRTLIEEKEFYSAPCCAALLLATLREELKL
jgi:hypothetical protein